MLYFFIVILCAAFLNVYIYFIKKDSKGSVILFYMMALLVAIVAGLRGNEDEYTHLYNILPGLNDFFVVANKTGKEFFFRFVVAFIKSLSLGPQFIFILFSSVAVFVHAYFFRKFTPLYLLAFLVYLSHEIALKEYTGLRLGFASALILPMIYFLQNKKYIKFFVTYIVSASVQYVGLLSILLIFLRKEIKHLYLWVGLIVAIMLYATNLTNELVYTLDAQGLFPQIVSDYLTSEYHTYDAGLLSHVKTAEQIIVLAVMLFLSMKYRRTLLGNFPYFTLIFNAYYLSTILLVTFSGVAIFAFRFASHFASVEPLIFCYIVYCFREKRLVVTLLSIFFIAVAYYNYIIIQRVSEFCFFWACP